MSTTVSAGRPAAPEPIEPPARPRRQWAWPHFLAIAAIPLMIFNIWTVSAWLADKPHQITAFRDGWDRDWYGARLLEFAVVSISLVVLYKVYKDCRAQRRFFTFDVIFLIAGASTWWANGVTNWFNATWLPSSNFVNVNDPCGYMPLIPNQECGRIPYPWLFLLPVESTVLLGFAMLMGWVVTKVRKSRELNKPKIWGLIYVGAVLAFLGEPLVIVQSGAWIYPGTPISVQIGTEEYSRYPIFPELLIASSFLALAAGLRYFRDDRGRTIVERGIDQYSEKMRKVITFMALYLLAHLNLVLIATIPLWPMSFHQNEWPTLPATLNNGVCDQEGVVENTATGLCPGEDGYVLKMPPDANFWHNER